MGRILNNLIPLLILAVVVFVFHSPLFVVSHQMIRRIAPCRIPISYAIASIDPRFDISTSAAEAAAENAIAVWEKAAGKDLFVRTEDTAVLNVRFIYDVRQETTETLKDIGGKIDEGTAAYNALEVEYKSLRSTFVQKREVFEIASETLQRDVQAYQKEVNSWNARRGARPSIVEKLNAEKMQLQSRQSQLLKDQAGVNAMADQVNSLAQMLNNMAKELNITAHTYNTVGVRTGEEFEEGVYESSAGHEDISIFEFDSTARLTRLLSHEFGHALGFDHVENKASIMYKLNQSSNIKPTAEDIAELKAVCGIL